MPQHIALLRGINVGGHRVKMDRLRSLFEDLGFFEVSTFIASGNVLFSTDSDDLDVVRESIERHLDQELGYDVATFLRTPSQLAEIAGASSPSEGSDAAATGSHYVIFMHAAASTSLRSALVGLASEMDAFEFSGTEIHWRIDGKLSESPLFGGGLDRVFQGIPTTMRNMNTIRRILAKTRTR